MIPLLTLSAHVRVVHFMPQYTSKIVTITGE